VFFRFSSAVILIVLVSLAGVAIEKRNLEIRRALSRQQYRTDVLLESYARLRLTTQQMADPGRLFQALERGDLRVDKSTSLPNPNDRSLR